MKEGDYGKKFKATVVNKSDNQPITDLDSALSVVLITNLNGEVNESPCFVEDPSIGLIYFSIPDGVLDAPGILDFEIKIEYPDGRFRTETLNELIKNNLG